MKLRTLRLHGFKSFADRTEVDFRDGVTAIVGSNGCGKSNLADAIRWVLGEQRAGAMRSAKMDEVIFAGTARRRPLNFAEVSLLFSNEEGRVPLPQTEIEVARRTFREGGSDYSLNRTACRLRDIHGLLRDTGLGANAYAIIEGGMIESLLSERAGERRELFEEAAGVGKYKDSRAAAARRLAAAEGDLARLEDLLGEVETKVRSLARQKGRAQRFRELRQTKLQIEVALARREILRFEEQLGSGRNRHAQLEAAEAEARSAGAAAEEMLATAGEDAASLKAERSAAASRLDATRERVEAGDRALLLNAERHSHVQLRLTQLGRDQAELDARVNHLRAEVAALHSDAAAAAERVRRLEAAQAGQAEQVDATRSALRQAQAETETADQDQREAARDYAAARAELAVARERLPDAKRRLGSIADRERALNTEAEELAAAAAATAEHLAAARKAVAAAGAATAAASERRDHARAADAALHEAVRSASERVAVLEAQLAARESVERAYQGFAPAVAAVMAERKELPGVRGPLADFLRRGPDAALAEAAEQFLGPLLQAIIVDDAAAAARLRRWFHDSWKGHGSLLILPLDALPRAPGAAGTLPALPLKARGPAAGWLERLLRPVSFVDDPLATPAGPGPRVAPNGDSVDARGLVRLSKVGSDPGILGRRERLEEMRGEHGRAVAARDQTAGERQSSLRELGAAESALEEAEQAHTAANQLLREQQTAHQGLADRQQRLENTRRELAETLSAIERNREHAERQVVVLEERIATAAEVLEQAQNRADAARSRQAAAQASWEELRSADLERRVEVAAARGSLENIASREQSSAAALEGAVERIAAIQREGTELQETARGLEALRATTEAELAALRAQRARLASAVEELDGHLAALDSQVADASRAARAARNAGTEAGEQRHRLELELAEARSRIGRARERLEAEWNQPWELLAAEAEPAPADDALLRAELVRISEQLDGLGPVNMLAVEEHAEEGRRLEFLHTQHADLISARNDIAAAVRRIDETARDVFLETFEQVRQNFHRTFQSLFHGGQCDLWLSDPDDPLDSPIEIQTSPKGKRTQRIHLLSGGERTLTALALLFALYLVKPSPFCVLDEVDAPLDDSNVGRFIQLLQDFKADTQFVVITHNARTMEAADWLYGVTMEEAGVSSLVGVELQGAWAMSDRVA